MKIQFTIPFVGLHLIFQNREHLDELNINMGVHGVSVGCYDPNSNVCEKKVSAYKRHDSYKYNTDDWKIVHNITVYNKDDGGYTIDKHITLRLQTGSTAGTGSKIFEKITLPDIQVRFINFSVIFGS